MGKIVLIADVHGNYLALKSVIYDMFHKIDTYEYMGIIFVGDLLDYGVEPEKCLELLEGTKGFLVGVLGNHDMAILEQDYSRFNTVHGKESAKYSRSIIDSNFIWRMLDKFSVQNYAYYKDIMMCHGTDEDKWKSLFPNDYKTMDRLIEDHPQSNVFIVAHSHLQFCTEYKGKVFINPGSVGQPRNCNPNAQYAIIDLETHEVTLEQAEYNIDQVANQIVDAGLDSFLATRLYLGI